MKTKEDLRPKTKSIWVHYCFSALSRIKYGSIVIEGPLGKEYRFEGDSFGSHAYLKINDWKFCELLILKGDIGMGESYINGDWDSLEIEKLISFGIENERELAKISNGIVFSILFYRVKHFFNKNTKAGSERNIHAHYDLGNKFYELWLDKTMTYSSAYFATERDSLESAQKQKYQKILDKLDLKAGSHIIEIGCGWGGFAEYASNLGHQVTGVTISKEQLDYAKKRNEATSLVNIEYRDYRDLTGEYDAVVSIEMFEALGQEYWDVYFEKVESLLKSGGKALIQSITIDDKSFKRYSKSSDFIQQYIFPGGMLPTVSIFKIIAEKSGLTTVKDEDFGKSYAKTLCEWDKTFRLKSEAVKQLGFDEKFKRTWHFYLKYCQGGFENGKLGVSQFLLERKR